MGYGPLTHLKGPSSFWARIIPACDKTETYSDIAQAKPKPSYVEVPLPSSSMIIKEFSVAD